VVGADLASLFVLSTSYNIETAKAGINDTEYQFRLSKAPLQINNKAKADSEII
jgi:hypothetical protein